MMNKIFVFAGIGIGAILIIENLVTGMPAYLFLDSSAKSGTLSFISIIIGMFIGYGLKGMFEKDNSDEDENYDF